MAEIIVREATHADLPVLLEFEQGVITAERPYDRTIRDGAVHYYDLPALIDGERSRIVVAEIGGVSVGTGHASITRSKGFLTHEEQAYLGLMYVDPDYRGLGVIQEVLSDLMGWARGIGITDFYLDVYCRNESAVRAYENAGFKRVQFEMRLND